MKKDNKRRYDILKSGVCECASVCVCLFVYTYTYSDLLFSASSSLFPQPTCWWNNVVYWNRLSVMVQPSCFVAPNDLRVCVCVGVEVWRCATSEKAHLEALPASQMKLLPLLQKCFQVFLLIFLCHTHRNPLYYAINYSLVNRKAESTRLETNEMLSVAHSLECNP